ncbi:MAG TPA: hypothetical protein DEO32_00245 [Ruminococcaceae bacterium]|nr:hypothetical protein [Oscillospiraceae bacterium]
MIQLSEIFAAKQSFADYLHRDGQNNRAELDSMYSFLLKAMQNELTERQLDCLTMNIIEGRHQREIAETLGLNASTVNRHVMAAKRKLIRACKYYISA